MTDVTPDFDRPPLTLGAGGAYAADMPLQAFIFAIWGAFGLYWLIAAIGAKSGSRSGGFRPPGLLLVAAFLLLRGFKLNGLAVHSPVLQAVGVVLFLAGVGLAVWARIYLGRNWGMPMTRKDEPELVTSGPYRFVRHPIYSGLLLAVLGTVLATNIAALIALVLLGAYFVYSATVEERVLSTSLPAAYPAYQARTKMVIPFVL
jgi:protein-S-isoprenylcysteine O-methyltransferase Ste14